MYSSKSQNRIRNMKIRMGLGSDMRPVDPIVLTSDDFKPTNPSFYIEFNKETGQYQMVDE